MSRDIVHTCPGTSLHDQYGDYGEIAITNRGKSIGTWGEGLSYDGPGGVWFNRHT